MDAIHINLSKQLSTAGYSTTKARLAIFNVLLHQEPLTMADIITNVSKDVDRSSVYRAVELFEKLGIIQRLHIGWKYKIELSDIFHDHHHHMSCSRCGLLISIDGDSHIEKDIADLAQKHSFDISSHQLEILGICKNCQQADV